MFDNKKNGNSNYRNDNRKEHPKLDKNKEPNKQMTEKNNGLSSAQEVLYQDDYNKAASATKDEKDDKKK